MSPLVRPALRFVFGLALGPGLTLGLGACRYEVRLDDEDAPTLADAPVEDVSLGDAGPDATDDAGDDAPLVLPRPCEGEGVDLAPVLVTAFDDAASLAASGEGLTRRYGILVPPLARADGAPTSRLLVLDREGTVVADRELTLDATGGTLHADADGFLVLAAEAIHVLSPSGEPSGMPIPLPAPPRRAGARGWVDDARFAWVSSAPGDPIAVLDRTSGGVVTTPIPTGGSGGVLVHRGGITVVADAPANEITEYAPTLDGTATLRTSWDGDPLAHRLWGVETTTGTRRWIVTDGGEFRNSVALFTVPDSGPAVGIMGSTIFAPMFTELEGDLLTIGASDGQLWIFDFVRGEFRTITPPTGSTLGRVERDDEGYAELYLRLGATLAFRCGVP